MQKTTSKNLSKRLLQYSALSAAALGVADANGQIIYTDVDPDQVLNVGEEYAADLTGSGNEFTINNPSGLSGGNAAIVFPSSGGAFVGITAGGFEYPALLADGETIDATENFTTTGSRGDLNYYGCAYSNSQWCGAVTDGYLGVVFNLSGNTHYGWIRLDTDVNGSNLITVKDFAYNSVPDEAINAGESLGVSEFDRPEFVSIAYFDKAVTISNINGNAQYRILSIDGKQITAGDTSLETHRIQVDNLSSGIYIVEVIDSKSNAIERKKIVIQ